MQPMKVHDWNTDNDQVLILAGKRAEPIALNNHMYIYQNKRSFRPSRYMAFVNDGVIRYLFEVVAGPYVDCTPDNTPIMKTFEGYTDELHQIIYLKKVADVGPILNDTLDKNGDPTPYTQGTPRYTTYNHIMKACKTSELQ